jgi:hypothetical protein
MPIHCPAGWEGAWEERTGSQKTCSALVVTSFSARTEAGGRESTIVRDVYLAIRK